MNDGYKPYISARDLDIMRMSLSNVEMAKIMQTMSQQAENGNFGMAVSALLQTYGLFSPSDLSPSANSLSDIKMDANMSVAQRNQVRSIINYYDMMQENSNIMQAIYQQYNTKPETILKKIVSDLEAGTSSLLIYSYSTGKNIDDNTPEDVWFRNCAVAYDVKTLDPNDRISFTNGRNTYVFDTEILLYDSRYPNDEDHSHNLLFDSNSYMWMIPTIPKQNWNEETIAKYAIMPLTNHQFGTLVFACSDAELLNDRGLFLGTGDYQPNTDQSYLGTIMLNIKMSGTQSNGKPLFKWSTSAKAPTAASMMNGSNGGSSYFMDPTKSYTLSITEALKEAFRMRTEYQNCLLSASANCDSVSVNPNGIISCTNARGEYTLSTVMNEGYHATSWHTLSVTGADSDNVRLQCVPNLGGWILTGSGQITISASGNQSGDTAAYKFKNNGNSVLIYEKDQKIAFSDEFMRGDTDLNKTVEIQDAQFALKEYVETFAGNPTTFENETLQTLSADVNCDKAISVDDAQYILSYYTEQLAGIKPSWDAIIYE